MTISLETSHSVKMLLKVQHALNEHSEMSPMAEDRIIAYSLGQSANDFTDSETVIISGGVTRTWRL